MTDQEIETMANKIGEVAPDQVATFLANPDAFDYTVLEGYSDFTDKYKNVADFTGDKLGIKANIWKELDGKFPTKARFQSLQEKYPWLNEEDLKTYFNKTNEYKKFYEDESKKEADRKRREMEVKGTYIDVQKPEEADKRNWGLLRNILASEYEKQRYIDDPNAALIGYDAPKLGEAPETRWGATGDLAAGVAGAAGDFVPGVGGAFIGPSIRLGRDAAHKFTESPYQKDWQKIGKDFGVDVGVNLGAALLFNARKGANMTSKATDPEVKASLESALETQHIKSSLPKVEEHMSIPSADLLDFYRRNNIPYPSNDRVLRQTVKDLPASDMKKELLKVVNTKPGTPIKRTAVQAIVDKYERQTVSGVRDVVRRAEDNMKPQIKFGNYPVTNYLRNAADAKTFDELNNIQKGQYLANLLAMGINSGNIGQIAVQEGANITGRGSTPSIVENAIRRKEKEDTINRIISSYSILWNKNKEPVEAKTNTLIKEAWEKWRNE